MQLSEQLTRAFAEVGKFVDTSQGEISQGDYTVLARLAREECARSRDLAQAEGLDASTMSRRVTSLAERGLVERSADPADRRAQALSLTDAGRAALTDERARRVALITDALADWQPREKDALARLLGRLTDTLEARRSTP